MAKCMTRSKALKIADEAYERWRKSCRSGLYPPGGNERLYRRYNEAIEAYCRLFPAAQTLMLIVGDMQQNDGAAN